MSAPKWTPGPWSIHEHMGGAHETKCDDFTVHTVPIGAGEVLLGEVAAYRFRVADRYSGHKRVRSFEENLANGTLIAAAPDLAAALEPFAKFACDEPCECNNCKARAALAKARGEA